MECSCPHFLKLRDFEKGKRGHTFGLLADGMGFIEDTGDFFTFRGSSKKEKGEIKEQRKTVDRPCLFFVCLSLSLSLSL